MPQCRLAEHGFQVHTATDAKAMDRAHSGEVELIQAGGSLFARHAARPLSFGTARGAPRLKRQGDPP
ncbi:hypothetical protein DJ019_10240 [Phenylobacterium kunshanense]|uniref:Uncharacterized protein n=1 Tax=Phenylobacterium kunshanense TaxID=1445034 RepID=A0A328BEH2_9CAUL|nr:hypothetical protein DJ019_10240 [Phenylobacterium kunshanense]